jgi:hypothetical protein
MALDVTIRGVRASFFDSEKVLAAARKGTAKALAKCGAFVRREAKSSIRYATKSATPGQPPKAHRGRMTRTSKKKDGTVTTRQVSPLKELIYFAQDASGSVVVGPADFKNRAKRNYRVPTVLEQGGTVTRRTPKAVRTSRYPGNPFMAPALRKVQAKFPAMFQDLLR